MADALAPLHPVDLHAADALAVYLKSIAPVCPFIEPAAAGQRLFFSEITPDCKTAADIHPRLFEQLIPQIERFRRARMALADKSQKLLQCHIVVIRMRPDLDADTARLLNWPNVLSWSLKQLYTPKEIVLGFVRKGVTERSTQGPAIAAAPVHAVIIRSRVVQSDQRFFPNNRMLLDAMLEARDDGGNVHQGILPAEVDPLDPAALAAVHYFQLYNDWLKKTLAKK